MGFPDCLLKLDPNDDVYGSWVIPINNTKYRCKYCQKDLICARGKGAITDHAKAISHLKARKGFLDRSQSRLTSAPSGSSQKLLISYKKDEVLIKELLIVLHIVKENRSARSAEADHKFFKTLAPTDLLDSTLSDNKIGRIINQVLGPHSLKFILDDFQFKFYSISYDETENEAHVKELQITCKYFSKSLKDVSEFSLTTYFIGVATSEVLAGKILKSLEENDLSLCNLVMLGSDGPNVNKKVNHILATKVLEARGYKLLNIGTCPIHVLHLLFKKSISFADDGNKKTIDSSELSHSICQHFKKPAAQEKFTKESLSPAFKFVAHKEVRWCTLGPSVALICEKLSLLVPFFQKASQKPKSQQTYYEKLIFSLLSQQNMKAQMMFVVEIAKLMEPMLKFLEKREVLVFSIYQVFKEMVEKVLLKIVKAENIAGIFRNPEDLELKIKPIKDIKMSEDINSALEDADEATKVDFKKKYLRNLIFLCKGLLESCMVGDFYRYCQFLSPANIVKEINQKYVLRLAKLLDYGVQLEQLQDELDLIRIDEKLIEMKMMMFSKYLLEMSTLKFTNGNIKYDQIVTLLKMIIVVSHSQAEIERGFSDSLQILTSNRTRMHEQTFNSRKHIKAFIRIHNNDVFTVDMTQSLLKLANNSSQQYKIEQEEKKKLLSAESEKNLKDAQIASVEAVVEIKHDVEELKSEIKRLQARIKQKKTVESDLQKTIDTKLCAKATLNVNEMEYIKTNISLVKSIQAEIESIYAEIDKLTKTKDRKLNNAMNNYVKKT